MGGSSYGASAGSYVAVSFPAMEQAEATFGTLIGNFEDTVNTLFTQLGAVVWTGAANNAYQDAKNDWSAIQQNIAEVFQQLQIVIGKANTLYMETEAQNAAAWTS